jgi:hypothetical protein
VSGKSPPVLEDVDLTWKSRPRHQTKARLERIVFGEEQRQLGWCDTATDAMMPLALSESYNVAYNPKDTYCVLGVQCGRLKSCFSFEYRVWRCAPKILRKSGVLAVKTRFPQACLTLSEVWLYQTEQSSGNSF